MRIFVVVTVLGLVTAALPAAAHGADGKPSAAFQAYEKGRIPDRFKGRKNPLARTPDDIRAGFRFYQENCRMCHGADADGNGVMAVEMDKRPADLKAMVQHFPDVDDYYLWIISAGGAGFGIQMPGYDGILSERDIWRIVTWMQAGFPGANAAMDNVMPGPQMAPGNGPGMHMNPGVGMGPGMHMGPGARPRQGN